MCHNGDYGLIEVRGDGSVVQRSRRIQEPLQRLAKARHRWFPSPQFTVGVFDGTRQHVEIVVQPFQLASSHDQLVLADLQFTSPLP